MMMNSWRYPHLLLSHVLVRPPEYFESASFEPIAPRPILHAASATASPPPRAWSLYFMRGAFSFSSKFLSCFFRSVNGLSRRSLPLQYSKSKTNITGSADAPARHEFCSD